MKISIIQQKMNISSFKAGKITLYSDFDGTLLPQPLHDIYNGTKEAKEKSVEGFNKYFKEFQNFIDETKGKFSIKINTGRRLCGDNKEGFEPTLSKMRESGIVLPQIDSIITSSGGDIYHFNNDGTINHTKDILKTKQVKDACGWDWDEITKTLNEVANETGTKYKYVNDRGSYKLSVALDDKKQLSSFQKRLQEILTPKMGIKIELGDVKITPNTKESGLKLSPIISGHGIHKDFDIKNALKSAVQNNDFLIIAGDADNDKEALNIFRYLKKTPSDKIPTSTVEITPEYISKVKREVNDLPIKIMFIEPNKNCTDTKTLKLYDFMLEQEKHFPKKVQIVKETKLEGENNFLNAIKSSIEEYSAENKVFDKNFKGKTIKNFSKSKIILMISIATALLSGIFILYKHKKTKTTKAEKN